jgi:hypothetical protein
MKREIPIIITFFTGVIIVVAFFVPVYPLGSYKEFPGLQDRLLKWYSILLGFTMILGIDTLIMRHWRKIKSKSKDALYSAALIASIFVTLFVGIFTWIRYGELMASNSPFMFYYDYVFVPLQSTMFALLAFFIASAAYRAFRARTLEATLLLIAAGIVMIGRVPVGENLLNISLFGYQVTLPKIAAWIMDTPNMAAQRAIWIGVALGGIAMSLRIILGIEKTYLS